MPDIVEKLKSKMKKIAQFQQKKSHQEGQKEQLFKRLKDVAGVNSVDEAEEKIVELGQELVENEKILNTLDKEMGEIISAAETGSGSRSE